MTPSGLLRLLFSLFAFWPSVCIANPLRPGVVDLPWLRNTVIHLRERLTEFTATDDLLDELHFGWFDRLYARATLAVLTKTTLTLAREVRLRERNNGAIPDATVRNMVSWSERAVERVAGLGVSSDFRPHRLRVTVADLSSNARVPPLFGFLDLATATRHDDRFGDLDLLVAMGYRVYPTIAKNLLVDSDARQILKRADALGVGVIVGTGPDAAWWRRDATMSAASVANGAWSMRPVPLKALFRRPAASLGGEGRMVVVADVTPPESITGSLARRALARGFGLGGQFAVDGWHLPTAGIPPEQQSSAARALMWVHAIEGQSLGVLRGWRDLRDGSGSPYRSVFLRPAFVEAIAHTALDIIRLGDYVGRFGSTAPLAVVVGSEAVDSEDQNRWATWVEPIWAELLRRQIRFDVVPSEEDNERLGQRYQVLVPLSQAVAADLPSAMLKVERALAAGREQINRVKAHTLDGTLAVDTFVRDARTSGGRLCVVLVNLSSRARQIRLQVDSQLGRSRDVLSNTMVDVPTDSIDLGPWQVRLLWPA